MFQYIYFNLLSITKVHYIILIRFGNVTRNTLFLHIVRAYIVMRIVIYFIVSNHLNEFIIVVMYFLSCISNIFYF